MFGYVGDKEIKNDDVLSIEITDQCRCSLKYGSLGLGASGSVMIFKKRIYTSNFYKYVYQIKRIRKVSLTLTF